jgi:hypothetical protein
MSCPPSTLPYLYMFILCIKYIDTAMNLLVLSGEFVTDIPERDV